MKCDIDYCNKKATTTDNNNDYRFNQLYYFCILHSNTFGAKYRVDQQNGYKGDFYDKNKNKNNKL